MSENAKKMNEMFEYLPEDEQALVLRLVEKLMPDDVATPDDLAAISKARAEFARGEGIPEDEIEWK